MLRNLNVRKANAVDAAATTFVVRSLVRWLLAPFRTVCGWACVCEGGSSNTRMEQSVKHHRRATVRGGTPSRAQLWPGCVNVHAIDIDNDAFAIPRI